MLLNPQDLDAVCDLIQDLCGIHLDETKSYLIETRLADVAERHNCAGYMDLVGLVRNERDLTVKQEIVDAITTQETLFFRDMAPFAALKNKALPELIDTKQDSPFRKRIRVWSAACSTGQEPYSIAMTICDLLPDVDSWDVQILATDISDAAIAKASKGCYSQHEVERGLPPDQCHRYFKQNGNRWQIDDRVRAMVAFRRFNLHDSFDALGSFDVIFCRNVAIYFTPERRRSLFARLAACLSDVGYMFVGSSETLADLGQRFAPQAHCRSVFYQPNLATYQHAPCG